MDAAHLFVISFEFTLDFVKGVLYPINPLLYAINSLFDMIKSAFYGSKVGLYRNSEGINFGIKAFKLNFEFSFNTLYFFSEIFEHARDGSK